MDLLPRIVPGRRVGPHRGRAGPAGHRPQRLPRRPLRGRAGRHPRRHRPDLAGRVVRRVLPRGLRHPGAARAPAAWCRASTSCATARAPTACSRTTCATRAASRYVIENRVAMTRVLPTVFADQQVRSVDHYGRSLLERPGPGGAAGVGRPAHRRRAHPGRVQLRLLRARVPGLADGRRAGRGPRPRGRRPRGVDAHHPRPPAGRRHLPPHRRRLPRPGRVPARLDARRARAHGRGPGRQRHHRQRGRQRRGRRQGRLRLRARRSSATTSARSRSCPTSRPTCCGTRTSGPRCSTGSTSWWSSRWPRPAATAS